MRRWFWRSRSWLIPCLALAVAMPQLAAAKDKKKKPKRTMIENMMAVPCGAKQHGITGLGSLWASAGVEHVNSDEKLCPQYLLRTDEMEYLVRPRDKKHPVILPVGEEGEFKIKKDELQMKIPDGDRKMRSYQVVSIAPVNQDANMQSSTRPYRSPATMPAPTDRPMDRSAGADRLTGANSRPPQ